MYSTTSGAKAGAKSLKKLFDESGLIYPLNRCQHAVARAGGFRDWHDLDATLSQGTRPLEPGAYRRRLLAALPSPCHPPVRAHLDGWEAVEDAGPDVPVRWFRTVWPYHFGAGVLHRSQTPLLRPGSGTGQRLRLDLVQEVLLSARDAYPQMEPDTLSFVYTSDLTSLFGELRDHPRFPIEFANLMEAGIFSWTPAGEDGAGTLRVHPPEGLEEKVIGGAINLAEYEASGGRPRDTPFGALRDALNRIGVDDASRVARAISEQGSPAYTTPSGPVLTLLSELASEGAVETFANAVRLFSTIHPASAASVRAQAPAKIVQYWCGPRGLPQDRVARWTVAERGWSDEIIKSLDHPGAFAGTVERLALAIEA